MKALTTRLVCALTLAVVILGGLPAASARQSMGDRQVGAFPSWDGRQLLDVNTASPHPKLEGVLQELVAAHQAGESARVTTIARQRQIDLTDNKVCVILEADPDRIAEATAAIVSMGAAEETRHQNLLQVRVPLDKLDDLANLPSANYVRMPFHARSLPVARTLDFPSVRRAESKPLGIVTSEGVAKIGANLWQDAGIRGQGITVAIIDLGFAEYQSRLGAELPSTVKTQSFRADGDITAQGETHGTMVAEIIHDVAPDAALLLVNFGTDVEWANAVDYVIAQGVEIVSSSISFVNSGPLDGTGFFSDKVNQARQAGIFWAQSSGNYAMDHWSGSFVDANGNSVLDFAPGVELNTFDVPPGSVVEALLSWNDWPASSQDYNLYLVQIQNGRAVTVDQSTTVQDGTQEPFERVAYPTVMGGTFGVAIQKAAATRDVRFDLFMFGIIDPSLRFQVAASSLGIPADAPGAISVGATAVTNDALEPFSSQGPTVDGRLKPDLAAPDGVTTSFGEFLGTSASSPHVAAAAALVKSANPSLGPAEIQSFLEQRAADLGPPGNDDLYGAGRLNLGPPPGGSPGPAAPLSAADAKIEIVFPHDAAGNPASVTSGGLANIGAFLFSPNSLTPVPCSFNQPVRLYRAQNTAVAEQVGIGEPQVITRNGMQITQWQFNNVDVSGAIDPLNKYYFFLTIDGLPTSTNVWSHGADARTIFPNQDTPTAVGPLGATADAKIEIVFPHDQQGNPQPVTGSDLVNLAVDVFAPGTLVAASPDTDLTVRLFRSLNNGMQELVGVGQKQIVTQGSVPYPQWVFNDVDVSASKDPLNKYYFRVAIDGVATRSNIWSHGADARTIFPEQDVPTSSCP